MSKTKIILIAVIVFAFLGLLLPSSQSDTETPARSAKDTLVRMDWGRRFESVAQMIQERGKFEVENGTLAIISSEPLHIQLAPPIVSGDYPGIVRYKLKRAALYGIYRAFIHTDIDSLSITVVPQLRPDLFDSSTWRLLQDESITISINREAALAVAGQLLSVNSFSDLIAPDTIGNVIVSGGWSEDFQRAYFTDHGPPGLNHFFAILTRRAER